LEGLWHTWFDRDLGISGRVFCRSENGDIKQRLMKIDRAILRVPNLAIHLQSAEERKGFAPNKEDHLSPIIAMAAQKALSANESSENKGKSKEESPKDGWVEYQEPLFLKLLASELGVEVGDIVDFELSLFDIQKAALGGVHSEFVYSARLDNLASCFLAVEALLDCVQEEDYLEKDKDISMVVLYDHEEVGSSSA
jgi:aspartyl aminopeptidase